MRKIGKWKTFFWACIITGALFLLGKSWEQPLMVDPENDTETHYFGTPKIDPTKQVVDYDWKKNEYVYICSVDTYKHIPPTKELEYAKQKPTKWFRLKRWDKPLPQTEEECQEYAEQMEEYLDELEDYLEEVLE